MKTCNKCLTLKNLDEFHNSSRYIDKKFPTCKKCRSVYMKSLYNSKRPEIIEKQRQYYSDHKDEINIRRNTKKYGITVDTYLHLLEIQNHCCAICGTSESDVRGRRFNIDHDHSTGKVRGLLCWNCNSALGNAKDSVVILSNMIRYIKEFDG